MISRTFSGSTFTAELLNVNNTAYKCITNNDMKVTHGNTLYLHFYREPQIEKLICVTYLLFIHGIPDRGESKGRHIHNHCLIINDCLRSAPWGIQKRKKKRRNLYYVNHPEINSYMCVLLVEERQEGFWERKGSWLRGAQMKIMGWREEEEGWNEKKGRREREEEDKVKVGRFPGGPMSWDSHYLPPWIPRVLPLSLYSPFSSFSPVYHYSSSVTFLLPRHSQSFKSVALLFYSVHPLFFLAPSHFFLSF